MTQKLYSLVRSVIRGAAALVLALLVFTAIPLASQAAIWGQDSDAEMAIKRDASELLSSFGNYGVQQRKQAVSAMSDAFDSLDRQTDAVKQLLENSLAGMNAASRKQAEMTLREIDQQRSNLADLLDQARRSPDDAWDSVKDQFVDATSGLLQALENASA
jgi:hypothetical protein